MSGDNRKRKDFQALQQQIRRKIKRSYQAYPEGLLGISDNDQTCDRKKLFSFHKRSRHDQQGPSPLLENGKLTENTTEQCNIHNKQFQSAFTLKSPLSLALLSQMKLQDLVDKGQVNPESVPQNTLNSNRIMPDISINGILKRLNNLKLGKAAGLDSIQPILLKELRVELALIIKVIFERSLQTGKLPADWCKANVTPIFKKGGKSLAANYRPISLMCILCKMMMSSGLTTHQPMRVICVKHSV